MKKGTWYIVISFCAFVITAGLFCALELPPNKSKLMKVGVIAEKSRPVVAPPSSVTTTVPSAAESSAPVQYVLLSFDGSRSLDMWEKTRAFARDMQTRGKPVHFTYFISGVYFLDKNHVKQYQPPRSRPGISTIGFGTTPGDVAERVKEVNGAIAEGHEIGSHVNGHFNGSDWGQSDWQQEFDSFSQLISNVAANNAITSNVNEFKLNISPHDIIGFRAPDLGVSRGLWPVMKKFGFAYDASRPAKLGTQPYQISPGIWELPLSGLTVGVRRNHVLSMDYNFYIEQTGGVSIAHRNSPLWNVLYQEMLDSYRAYFKTNYEGDHAPVIIGHHFSLWNDGVYWEALKTFADEVCGRADVRCVTFREYVQHLNSTH